MSSPDAASQAADKLHKKYIDNRYIEVFQVGGGVAWWACPPRMGLVQCGGCGLGGVCGGVVTSW